MLIFKLETAILNTYFYQIIIQLGIFGRDRRNHDIKRFWINYSVQNHVFSKKRQKALVR